MKYYLISMQRIGESNPVSIFAYDTREAVIAAFHSTLASNYSNSELDFFNVMIITETGQQVAQEHYYKPVDPVFE